MYLQYLISDNLSTHVLREIDCSTAPLQIWQPYIYFANKNLAQISRKTVVLNP